jgi:hypothetical protein
MKGWLDKYQVGGQANKWQVSPKAVAANKAARQPIKDIDAAASNALEKVTSYPQRKATELITGKNQYPAEAMGITNPLGVILANSILDPANLLGVGEVKAASKLLKGAKGAKKVTNVADNIMQHITQDELMDVFPTLTSSSNNMTDVRRATQRAELRARMREWDQQLNNTSTAIGERSPMMGLSNLPSSVTPSPAGGLMGLTPEEVARTWENYVPMDFSSNWNLPKKTLLSKLKDKAGKAVSVVDKKLGEMVSPPRKLPKGVSIGKLSNEINEELIKGVGVKKEQYPLRIALSGDLDRLTAGTQIINPATNKIENVGQISLSRLTKPYGSKKFSEILFPDKNPTSTTPRDVWSNTLGFAKETDFPFGNLPKDEQLMFHHLGISGEYNKAINEVLKRNNLGNVLSGGTGHTDLGLERWKKLANKGLAEDFGDKFYKLKKDGGWLEKYNDGGPIQPNYNDYSVSAGPGFEGDGYSNVGRNYSPAWGGQFQDGGEIAQTGKKVPFDQWYKTVPKAKNDTINYNLRRAYELAPQKELDAFVKNPKAHLMTAYENPETGIYEFMKSKNHSTIQKELDFYNSKKGTDFRNSYDLDTTNDFYRYVPKKEMAMGGSLPGATGFMYARVGAPSNGKYAKKTKASAQNGTEMKFYQEGLDFKPKSMQKGGKTTTKFLPPQFKRDEEEEEVKPNPILENTIEEIEPEINDGGFWKSPIEQLETIDPYETKIDRLKREAPKELIKQSSSPYRYNMLRDAVRHDIASERGVALTDINEDELTDRTEQLLSKKEKQLDKIPIISLDYNLGERKNAGWSPATNSIYISKDSLGWLDDDINNIGTNMFNSLLHHELRHSYDKGGEYLTNYEKKLIDDKRKKDISNENYLYQKEYNYLNNPWEITARLEEIRTYIKPGGEYDPSKDKATVENLRKAASGSKAYNDLLLLMSPQDIVDLLNTIATNNPKQGMPAAKNGKKVIKDDRGQWDHPGEITEIGSNQITMQGVPYPVMGISDTGDMQMMYPNQEYQYDGDSVTEYPMMAEGGKVATDTSMPRMVKTNKKSSLINKQEELPLYYGPNVFENCVGAGCSKLATTETANLYGVSYDALSPQDAWYKKAAVLKDKGKQIWDPSKSDYSGVKIGDFVSMDRFGHDHDRDVSPIKGFTLADNEKVEHVGTVIGRNEQGIPLVKHGSEHGKVYVQPITDLVLPDANDVNIPLYYKPKSIYRSAAVENLDLKNKKYYTKPGKIDPIVWQNPTETPTENEKKYLDAINKNAPMQQLVYGLTPEETKRINEVSWGIFHNETKAGATSKPVGGKMIAASLLHAFGRDNAASLGDVQIKYDDLMFNKDGSISKTGRLMQEMGVNRDGLYSPLEHRKDYNDEVNSVAAALATSLDKIKNNPTKYKYNPDKNTVYGNIPVDEALATIYRLGAVGFKESALRKHLSYGKAAATHVNRDIEPSKKPIVNVGGQPLFAKLPKKEQGGQLTKLDQLTNFTNYNTKQPGGWLDKYQ